MMVFAAALWSYGVIQELPTSLIEEVSEPSAMKQSVTDILEEQSVLIQDDLSTFWAWNQSDI